MDLAPAVQEAARLWEPNSVPRGTATETVRCLSTRTQTRFKDVVSQGQRNLHRNLDGVQPAATSGRIKGAVIIQSVGVKGQRRVVG